MPSPKTGLAASLTRIPDVGTGAFALWWLSAAVYLALAFAVPLISCEPEGGLVWRRQANLQQPLGDVVDAGPLVEGRRFQKDSPRISEALVASINLITPRLCGT